MSNEQARAEWPGTQYQEAHKDWQQYTSRLQQALIDTERELTEFLLEVSKTISSIEIESKSYTPFYRCPTTINPQRHEKKQDTKPMGNCLLEANKVINGERQDEYGNPENSFKIIAEYWTTFLKHKYGLSTTLTPLDITNMMVLFKQARKLGQKHKRDNYVDSCGYEAIGADRLS